MALTNPVDLFAEFETLNGQPLDTSGSWKIIGAPSFPVTLCTSCDGGSTYTDVSYSLNDILCAGDHDPLIDFSGASGACTPGNAPNGEYVFQYYSVGTCPAAANFVINVSEGDATITFQRTPNVCWIEMYSENPDTPGSKEAKIFMTSPNRLCFGGSLRYKTVRKDLDGCNSPITTLDNTVKSYGDLTRTSLNLPKPLGDTAPFINPNYSFQPTPGIFLMSQIRLQLGGWQNGDYIEYLRVYRDSAFPTPYVDIDLSAVVLAGDIYAAPFGLNYVNALRTELASQLTAEGATNLNALFTVQGYDLGNPIGNPELVISFLCCNDPTAEWWGINRTDWEISWYDNGGSNHVVENNSSNDFSQWEWDVLNYVPLWHYYEIPDCSFYTNFENDCSILARSFFCTNDYSNIYDLTNSNYNQLFLAAGTKASILDTDDACTFP